MSHHYIDFKNVSYEYGNGIKALDNVSFRITHGEKVALVGSNGAGKSTIVLHSNGLLLPTSGEINVGGLQINKSTLNNIRQAVGIVFQNPDDQLFMPSVKDDIAFGPLNMKLDKNEVEKRVNNALAILGIEKLANRNSYQLSGGEKRSVSIATVLAMEPNILVMDEPSSNLDPQARRKLIEQVRLFHHTCIIATHDMDMAWELCPRTIVLKNGAVYADGFTKNILSDEDLMDKAGLEVPISARIK